MPRLGVIVLVAFVIGLGPLRFPIAGAAPDDAPAAVLGLDTAASEEGERLTEALRRAFARRGLSGPVADLVEVRLGLGCSGDDPACLAGGGEALGVRRLIYGHLRADADAYELELTIVEVETASVLESLSMSLSSADLLASNVETTAERVVAQLVPDEGAPSPARVETTSVPPNPPPPPSPAVAESPRPDDPGRLVWSVRGPRPKWKWVGFGVSAGLTLASVGVLLGLRGQMRGPLLDELHEAADASLTDDNRSNDIDRTMVSNICDAARATPPGFEPSDDQGRPIVTNESVTGVCDKADKYRLGAQVGMGFAVASAVSTVIFTTLLFVHRRGSKKDARRARRTRWAVSPQLDGVSLTIAGSF